MLLLHFLPLLPTCSPTAARSYVLLFPFNVWLLELIVGHAVMWLQCAPAPAAPPFFDPAALGTASETTCSELPTRRIIGHALRCRGPVHTQLSSKHPPPFSRSGHNVAWNYADYSDAFGNGCARLGHAPAWLALGAVCFWLYPWLIEMTEGL